MTATAEPTASPPPAPPFEFDSPPLCRRCKYDLTGLAGDPTASGEAAATEPLCPECGMPLRMSCGPLIHALDDRALRRLEVGCRVIGWCADLFSASAFMVLLMHVVGAYYWLDPFSVAALNGVLLAAVAITWIVAAGESRKLVVWDPVRQRPFGVALMVWIILFPVTTLALLVSGWTLRLVAVPLLVVDVIALPAVTVRYLRRLARLCHGSAPCAWADGASFFGSLCIAGTYLMLFVMMQSRSGEELAPVVMGLAMCGLQVFAWAFRMAARDVAAVRRGRVTPTA